MSYISLAYFVFLESDIYGVCVTSIDLPGYTGSGDCICCGGVERDFRANGNGASLCGTRNHIRSPRKSFYYTFIRFSSNLIQILSDTASMAYWWGVHRFR